MPQNFVRAGPSTRSPCGQISCRRSKVPKQNGAIEKICVERLSRSWVCTFPLIVGFRKKKSKNYSLVKGRTCKSRLEIQWATRCVILLSPQCQRIGDAIWSMQLLQRILLFLITLNSKDLFLTVENETQLFLWQQKCWCIFCDLAFDDDIDWHCQSATDMKRHGSLIGMIRTTGVDEIPSSPNAKKNSFVTMPDMTSYCFFAYVSSNMQKDMIYVSLFVRD